MLNPLENIITQGFATQSPDSEAKFRAELMESMAKHAKEKAQYEIMENVAQTLSSAGIQFKLTKKYTLDMTNIPIPNEHAPLVNKAVEIVKKYGREEVVFEH